MLAGKFADKGLPNEDFHPGSGHTEEICIAVSPPPREAPFGAEKNWVTIEDFHPGCDVPKKFVSRILPRQKIPSEERRNLPGMQAPVCLAAVRLSNPSTELIECRRWCRPPPPASTPLSSHSTQASNRSRVVTKTVMTKWSGLRSSTGLCKMQGPSPLSIRAYGL